MRVAIASQAEVDQLWPLFADGFSAAQKRTDSTWDSGKLWQLCRSGNAFLVTAFEDNNADMQMVRKFHMVGVFRFETQNDETVFHCMGLHGKNMRAWVKPVTEFAANIARENGAASLTAEGRPGWARVFGIEKTDKTYKVEI